MFKGGGVQECVMALQHELESRGHEALIITPRPSSMSVKRQDSLILVGGAKDVKSPFHTTAQVSASLDTKELDDMLKTYKFDILHFHEPWVPLISWQILTRSHCVNVASFHAKLPETVMSKTIEKVITPYTKSILKYVHATTAVSDAASEYITSLSKEKPDIIPNGIDTSKYKPLARPESTNLSNNILYIGRLEKRKGLKYLLDAFLLLQETHPEAKLIIAGEGSDKSKLQSYAVEKKIRNVSFLGHISENKKLELLQSARIFCSPALYGESFGIVLLEAMAVGAVTVAGDNPGYSSVLKDRGTISLVNPKDTTEFVRRLALLMSDNEIRSIWRKWAFSHVKRFDYKTITDMYEEVYRSAVRSAGAKNHPLKDKT